MSPALGPIDLALIAFYFAFLVFVAISNLGAARGSVAEYLIMGRRLALPSFVATLVTTWYGGVLGVGEFTYRYGIANWIVFGVPYYVGAALFALLMAKRARRSRLYSVPDQLESAYGRPVALLGAFVLQFLSSPAPYVLMLGVLLQAMFGWSLGVALVVGTATATAYSLRGGLRSVVRADLVQFALMYVGFLIALPLLAFRHGGLEFLHAHVPATHFVWHGGSGVQYILVWYFIALQTLVEPTFYQRAFAAADERVARRGVLISIGFWMLFDFLTTSTGLYARALMPDLADPVQAFPALAVNFLPPIVSGLFYLGLLATVMSTVDGYTFIGGVNFGRDLFWRWRKEADETNVNRYVQVGFFVTALLALSMAAFFRSAVDLWHDVGSVGVSALLIPLLTSYVPRLRMTSIGAIAAIILGGGVAVFWLLWPRLHPGSGYLLQLEPIYAGLGVSVLIWAATFWSGRRNLPTRAVI